MCAWSQVPVTSVTLKAIAVQQYRNNRIKLRYDLYDRRLLVLLSYWIRPFHCSPESTFGSMCLSSASISGWQS